MHYFVIDTSIAKKIIGGVEESRLILVTYICSLFRVNDVKENSSTSSIILPAIEDEDVSFGRMILRICSGSFLQLLSLCYSIDFNFLDRLNL